MLLCMKETIYLSDVRTVIKWSFAGIMISLCVLSLGIVV